MRQHRALSFCLSMIFSENRYPLFRIMLDRERRPAAIGADRSGPPSKTTKKKFGRQKMRLRFKPPYVVLAILCVMYLITYVDRVNISTAASEIQKELGLSNTQLGLVFSAFAYPYLLFQVIGGWIGDRFGPRKTLFWCGMIWAVSTIATGFVTSLLTLFIARVALGFGEGATFPTATRAMQYWTPANKRGFAQGLT